MDKTENQVNKLAGKLEEVLRATDVFTDLKATHEPATGGPDRPDLIFDLTHRDHVRYQLIVEFKAPGHPRVLREATNQLLRYLRRDPKEPNRTAEPVVAAPYISEEGATVCRELNVSYCDIAGNCRLKFGNVYIERTGMINKTPRKTADPDLFAPKSERVLRILLRAPHHAWKVAPLAEEADVSLGTVSTIRTGLLNREWAKETDDGIVLTRADKILQEWAAVWGRRRYKEHRFLALTDIGTTEKRLAEAARNFPDQRFALTGLSAAWQQAPWVNHDHILAYWSGDAEALAQAARLKATDGAANVHLIVPRDIGVFTDMNSHAPIPTVSSIQTYLDLAREPGRGSDAAQFLWDTVLFPGNATKH
ncbi:MAG: type IV toxin-antitoxin system AbiEi family antitoxin [Lacunisphaera sp.]